MRRVGRGMCATRGMPWRSWRFFPDPAPEGVSGRALRRCARRHTCGAAPQGPWRCRSAARSAASSARGWQGYPGASRSFGPVWPPSVQISRRFEAARWSPTHTPGAPTRSRMQVSWRACATSTRLISANRPLSHQR
jgi:hypothetical protein